MLGRSASRRRPFLSGDDGGVANSIDDLIATVSSWFDLADVEEDDLLFQEPRESFGERPGDPAGLVARR
jgi:hypothetical protein